MRVEKGEIETLEWDRLIHLGSEKALSEPGRERVCQWADPKNWAGDIASARQRQSETQEMGALLDRAALWDPVRELSSVEDLFESLEKGAVLDLNELVELRAWLYAIDSWAQFPETEIPGALFRSGVGSLFDPYELIRLLEKVLTPKGQISENASPKLSQLFSEIRGIKTSLDKRLSELMETLSQDGILQEKFSDVRDGRHVLPVKISSQSKVEGIVYDTSVSRQTVFIEPREVERLNNQLRQKENEREQEIFRILKSTTESIRPFASEIERSYEVIVYWDAVRARANLARSYGGKFVQVVEDRDVHLKMTAHPLLWWSLPNEEIIRNDVFLDSGHRTLLITGPNTGGKTVLLKTIALAGVCARTGFFFPGVGHPRVPFFDSFFIDLGDPQSIERQISSFSGHVLKMKAILENFTDRSLILVDELNSATDPEEGAALGRAFLEQLSSIEGESGPVFIATTHDPQLKALAYRDERILNAGMQFDEDQLVPTYRLQIGSPGRSRALDTARRLGIPETILKKAESYLTQQHLEFEKVLSQLEKERTEVARIKNAALRMKEDAEKLKEKWSAKMTESISSRVEQVQKKLRHSLIQAQDELSEFSKNLRESKQVKRLKSAETGLAHLKEKATQKIEKVLEEEAPEVAELIKVEQEQKALELCPIEVGALVRVPKWKSLGRILEMKGNQIAVSLTGPTGDESSQNRMAGLRVTMSKSDVEALYQDEVKRVQSQGAKYVPGSQSVEIQNQVPDQLPSREIDLRGFRVDDALRELESYLDRAYRSGFKEVRVIHGLGTGAIRESARELMKTLPYVKSFKDAGKGGGGTGATTVEFDLG